MSRGIYITANDKVMDHAIALLNSVRLHDPDIPIVLIPYNDDYHEVAACLEQRYGVTVYEDLEFIERISTRLYDIFGEGFFARPNQFRKQACWFGPFDEFVYIDTDIVVFESISQNMNYLKAYDFICSDYQHKGGIENVFTVKVLDEQVFTPTDLYDIFNGGFWGSKKGLISESDIYETFRECAAHPDYFDFSQKTSDQPIINYMILKRLPKRFNIVRREGGAPGNWGGSSHFEIRDDFTLFDPRLNQPLQYIHWAGIRIEPGCPYWDIWKHYRYLGGIEPSDDSLRPEKTNPSFWQSINKRLRTLANHL
ncbi:MAG: Npun_R2821/Npun_R2822 family protein [Cyanobacteria bacterium P01_F01_bin.150]